MCGGCGREEAVCIEYVFVWVRACKRMKDTVVIVAVACIVTTHVGVISSIVNISHLASTVVINTLASMLNTRYAIANNNHRTTERN